MTPEVRGRYMVTFFRCIDARPEAPQIRATLDPVRLSEMERASGFLDWLPVTHNVQATHAVAKILGPRRAHDFFAALQLSELSSPLFSWVRKLTPTLHHDPVRTLGWVAKGYGLMFRGAGTWTILDVGPAAATLELTGVPELMSQDGVWMSSVGSALHAVYRVSDVDGAVTMTPDRPNPRFRFRWTNPPKPG